MPAARLLNRLESAALIEICHAPHETCVDVAAGGRMAAMGDGAMSIPSRLLRQFVEIVEARSISAAARHLRMSQSALSAALQRLEDEVGSELLVRGSDFALTDAGRLTLEHARLVVAELQRVDDVIDELRAGSAGRVSIAVLSDFAASPTAELAAAFLRLAPSARVEVTIHDFASTALASLQDGQCDVAILDGTEASTDFEATALPSQRLHLIVPPSWTIDRGAVRLHQLGAWPVIDAGRGTLAGDALEALRRAGARPRTIMQTTDGAAILAAVARGIGAAIVTSGQLEAATAVGCVAVSSDELAPVSVRLVRRKGPSDPLVRVLLAGVPDLPAAR